MTNTLDHTQSGYSRVADDAPRQPRGRAWALTGAVAGVAGAIGIIASMSIDAVYSPSSQGDPASIVTRLGELTTNMLVFHTAMMVATVLLIVFAAGLRHRLSTSSAPGSLLPDVAAGGLMLTAVAGLMGTGLNTEFIFAVADPGTALVPEAAVMYGHWVGTIPWLWVGSGITGVALAFAGLRQGAVPLWLGWVGAVLGGLTLLFGLSPLQYMAGFTGPVLVAVVGLGFLFGDRVVRA